MPWIENHFIKRVKKYCRVVTIVHDVVPFNNRVNEQSALKKIYNLSDTLVVHSKRAMSELIRLYSLKKDIEVVSGAFCDKEIYKSESKEISRENLGINKDSFVVLFYGSIRESKGLDILLEAIQIANKKNPKVFLLAGGSLQGISKERERVYRDLASAVNSENIGDVKFEFVPIELEKYYFCASDVLCLPYRNGWQSGVAQLGLVYELPIIASDIDEMKEVVLNECNGLLFENNNPSDLANKIFYLSTNPKKQTIFKNNSSKIYMERFDLINKAKDFAEIFRKLYEPK